MLCTGGGLDSGGGGLRGGAGNCCGTGLAGSGSKVADLGIVLEQLEQTWDLLR